MFNHISSTQPKSCIIRVPALASHLSILLLDIRLSATLLRLTSIVLILVLELLRPITRDAGNSTTNSTLRTIGNTRSEIIQLALSLLALAGGILLITFALKALREESARIHIPLQGLPIQRDI